MKKIYYVSVIFLAYVVFVFTMSKFVGNVLDIYDEIKTEIKQSKREKANAFDSCVVFCYENGQIIQHKDGSFETFVY